MAARRKEPGGDLDPRLEPLRAYLLDKPAVTEEYPFGPEVMVFKLAGKMYALVAWEENPLRVSLKCDPDRALALREEHEGITAGYHLNKQLWNTITPGGTVSLELMQELADHSYELIKASLPRKVRDTLD
jgi:predicted DNA-binding protein (MmcQ/YjbR family)